jgi:hypothetical protein
MIVMAHQRRRARARNNPRHDFSYNSYSLPEMRVGSSVGYDVRSMMPGVSAPLGFFDPLGVTNNMSIGRVNFLRQVEVKHGRVAMVSRQRTHLAPVANTQSVSHCLERLLWQLASVGFLTAEQWHPLFGGHVDGPSLTAFQETAALLSAASGMYTPLQLFWPTVALFIGIPEIFSTFSYEVQDT